MYRCTVHAQCKHRNTTIMARRPSSSNNSPQNKPHSSRNLIKSVVKGWRRVESTDTRWRARGIIVITSASRSNLLVRHDICSLPSPDGRHNAVDLLSFTRPGLTRNPRHPLRHDARNHCAPGRKTTPTIYSEKKRGFAERIIGLFNHNCQRRHRGQVRRPRAQSD